MDHAAGIAPIRGAVGVVSLPEDQLPRRSSDDTSINLGAAAVAVHSRPARRSAATFCFKVYDSPAAGIVPVVMCTNFGLMANATSYKMFFELAVG